MSFPTRLDILPPGQRKLWPFLSPLKEMGYCLYGGTALALRYGHRPSVDFDFFSDRPLDKNRLEISLPWLTAATVLRNDPGLASLPESIKRMLTQEVKLVWDKPLPPSKRSGSGLVL